MRRAGAAVVLPLELLSDDGAFLQVLALEPGALRPTGVRQWTTELQEDSSAQLMAVYSEDLTSGEWTGSRLELA